MSSVNKRKEAVTAEETLPMKKLSRQARARRNKKQRREQEEIGTHHEVVDIVFDPTRHRTHGLCTRDKIDYLENGWISIPLCPSDRKSSKETKTRQEISTKDLLIETLVREAKSANNNSLEIPELPPDFLTFLDGDTANGSVCDNNTDASDDKVNNKSWITFGRWLGFREPIKRRTVRRHLKNLWGKLSHALDLQEIKDSYTISDIATMRNTRKEKKQLITSARGNFYSFDGLVNFHYIVEPECIVDRENRTLIHLEYLDDYTAVTRATGAVDKYYFHALDHPSHRSEEFWGNFIEHFGAYTLYNPLPYTSSNSASSHNIDHQECVNNLLQIIKPLSDSVNRFLHDNYGEMYTKLSNLSWGSFAPKSFGVFPMIAINYNTISDYHWDEHDEPNSLCCLVALGDFEGGELCFPQLQIIVPLRPGQVVAFSSRLLLHGNFPVTRGIRHSIVYFVHSTFFHHLRDFSEVYKDRKDRIERDARGSIVSSIPRQDFNNARDLNKQIRLSQPKKIQTEIPERSCDKRRGNIDLSRARRGLKAEDPLPGGI